MVTQSAEAHLEELSRMPRNERDKLEAERKRTKKERRAILLKIDQLEAQRCSKCIGPQKNTLKCNCPAAEQIRELGAKLSTSSESVEYQADETFNLRTYGKMKNSGMTDKQIMKKIRWSTVRFYAWKEQHGLMTRKSTVPPKKDWEGKELEGLTVETYQKHKSEWMTDKQIMYKYGITQAHMQAWKKDNGLVGKHNSKKPQKPAQQPKKKKESVSVSMVEKAKYEELEKKYEHARIHIGKLEGDVKELEEIRQGNYICIEMLEKDKAILAGKVSELEEALAQSDQASELTNLHFELERLKNFESDYHNLEVDYRNLHTENERLKRMLERLKHTERMNLWMMEHYVDMHKQLDEVTA